MALWPSKDLHFRYRHLRYVVALALGLWFWLCLPRPLFDEPLSFVLEDKDGHLLAARIAADEQWRFPLIDSVPPVFVQAITAYEDKRFFRHAGVDLRSVGRAIVQNIRNGRVVSGASTIDMQVIRLARKRRRRTLWQKMIEAIMALRLNLSYSKRDILRYYVSFAPFGGNVVGLEAATWRYYGKGPAALSVGEAATLAVLPNNPALIRPGKNEVRLRGKRNRLLDRMYGLGMIDSTTWVLSKDEPLPGVPHALPALAPHLLHTLAKRHPNTHQARFKSTVDKDLQVKVNQAIRSHLVRLNADEIHNCAVMVMEIESGNVLAYVGNSPGLADRYSPDVDILQAQRSTGSTLKPMLAALAMDAGLVTPNSLLKDIPTVYGHYRPGNFDSRYRGAVPLREALIRSLNVPFVRLLKTYGLGRYYHFLKKSGLTSLTHPPEYYGLTLVIGGAETSPWQLAGAYASWARMLTHFYDYDGRYDLQDIHPPYVLKDAPVPARRLVKSPPVVSAGAIWTTFQMMRALQRPDLEGHWQRFGSARPIAWKTGTSIGFRDAWAVGLDGRYLVVVWAGNADGEGRPSLIGVRAAAPILFDVFKLLPRGGWFDPPYDELVRRPVCARSGYAAGPLCPADSVDVPVTAGELPLCRYHRLIYRDKRSGLQATRNCLVADALLPDTVFVLSPAEAYYYVRHHPEYEGMPPFKAGCEPAGYQPVQFIYPPKNGMKLLPPVDLAAERRGIVFQVAYDHSTGRLFWHLDGRFIGTTEHFHTMELVPTPGPHRMIVLDEQGHRAQVSFEVAMRE